VTKLRKSLEQITAAENLFGLAALVCLVLAVAKLAGVFWAVLLLGMLLAYLAWVAHANQSDVAVIEAAQEAAIATAVHEALHAAKLDQEGTIAAIRAVTAQAIDEIRTEARRAELQAA
jgi:hypothetical protein